MNSGIKVALVAVVSFIAGAGTGYFYRKMTETSSNFQVVTDAEQLKAAEKDVEIFSKSLEQHMDETFGGKEEKEKEPETEETPTVKAINTQKTEYWKKFGSETAKYDRHSPLPEGEEPVVSETEFDQGFLNEAAEEDSSDDEFETEDSENVIEKDSEDVEESDLQEFYHWAGQPDGEYDTATVYWYTGDDTLTIDDEEKGEQIIKNPIGYLGFDPKKVFEGVTGDATDSDALYVKNNVQKTVFEVVRYKTNYSVAKRLEEFGTDGDK